MSHALPCNQYIVFHRDGSKEIRTKTITKVSFSDELGKVYKRIRGNKKTKK